MHAMARRSFTERPLASLRQGQLWRGAAGWTRWTAVLQQNAPPQKWAVDGWIYPNGDNPANVEVGNWDLAGLPQLAKAVE